MGNGKLTEHAKNLKGCEKCNLRKAVVSLGMLSELAFPHIRCCLSAIPSDLMKSTAVDESLSSMNQQFCSRECYNRMRNLHKQIFVFSISWKYCCRRPETEV